MDFYFPCVKCGESLTYENTINCVKCKSTYYCSVRCLKADLRKHKKTCVKVNIDDGNYYHWVNTAIEDNMMNLYKCSLASYQEQGKGCVFFDDNGNVKYYSESLLKKEYESKINDQTYDKIKNLIEKYDPEKEMITGYFDAEKSLFDIHYISLAPIKQN